MVFLPRPRALTLESQRGGLKCLDLGAGGTKNGSFFKDADCGETALHKSLFVSVLKLEWDCPALAKLSQGLFCVHFLFFFSQLSTPKQTIKRALSLSWNVGVARVELFQAC